MRLYLDTETYSATPIKHGTYRYLADAECMIMSWAVDENPVKIDDLTGPHDLGALFIAAQRADVVIAHNAMFDRGVARKLMGYGIPIHKWRCTMVQAMAHGLPGGLDRLCEILRVPTDKSKHKRGKELVKLFCMPRLGKRNTRETHPAEWAEFLAYAANDVEAMREVHKRLPTWNYAGAELAVWHLDQRINDRGVAVDLDLANAAIKTVEREQARLRTEAYAMTGGEVGSTTQRDALLTNILQDYGVLLPDLRADTLERRIADPDLPEGLRELLKVRLQASGTAVAKYQALVNATTDGRLRGALQFDGAARTGRWAGRTFQPQNLPRPTWNPTEADIGVIKSGVADLVFPNVMQACTNAIRGCIVAPKGRKLVVADLANIEGRAAAWLAGEEWKLDAFRAFDAGTGPDLYKVSYANSFGIDADDVTKDQRQIGKVQELMLGYEGGVGAYATGAATYGIDLAAMADKAWDSLPGDVLGEARGMLRWFRDEGKDPPAQYGMTDKTWLVCECFVLGWRAAHPAIKSTWKLLKEYAMDATQNPGVTFEFGKFKVRRDGAWLRIALPSGRALCYPQPEVDKDGLTYMGMNTYSRQWQRLRTYGGKLFENACQALAAHVLKDAMPRIESAGYEIVLTVHDEVICETEQGAVEEVAALLSQPPEWALDMPLAAAGFEATRYRKD